MKRDDEHETDPEILVDLERSRNAANWTSAAKFVDAATRQAPQARVDDVAPAARWVRWRLVQLGDEPCRPVAFIRVPINGREETAKE